MLFILQVELSSSLIIAISLFGRSPSLKYLIQSLPINHHTAIRMQTLPTNHTTILTRQKHKTRRNLTRLRRPPHRRSAQRILRVLLHRAGD